MDSNCDDQRNDYIFLSLLTNEKNSFFIKWKTEKFLKNTQIYSKLEALEKMMYGLNLIASNKW